MGLAWGDSNVLQPGDLDSAEAAVQLPHPLGGVPRVCGHQQLCAHLSARPPGGAWAEGPPQGGVCASLEGPKAHSHSNVTGKASTQRTPGVETPGAWGFLHSTVPTLWDLSSGSTQPPACQPWVLHPTILWAHGPACNPAQSWGPRWAADGLRGPPQILRGQQGRTLYQSPSVGFHGNWGEQS